MDKESEFEIGDIVRYQLGKTALMKITTIMHTRHHDTYHYRAYGDHILGGTTGADLKDCVYANAEEIKLYEKYRGK